MYIGPQGIVHGTTITVLNAKRIVLGSTTPTPVMQGDKVKLGKGGKPIMQCFNPGNKKADKMHHISLAVHTSSFFVYTKSPSKTKFYIYPLSPLALDHCSLTRFNFSSNPALSC